MWSLISCQPRHLLNVFHTMTLDHLLLCPPSLTSMFQFILYTILYCVTCGYVIMILWNPIVTWACNFLFFLLLIRTILRAFLIWEFLNTNFKLTNSIELWQRQRSKCYWIKQQTECFRTYPFKPLQIIFDALWMFKFVIQLIHESKRPTICQWFKLLII